MTRPTEWKWKWMVVANFWMESTQLRFVIIIIPMMRMVDRWQRWRPRSFTAQRKAVVVAKNFSFFGEALWDRPRDCDYFGNVLWGVEWDRQEKCMRRITFGHLQWLLTYPGGLTNNWQKERAEAQVTIPNETTLMTVNLITVTRLIPLPFTTEEIRGMILSEAMQY